MTVSILVVDDEPDAVELFRQCFRAIRARRCPRFKRALMSAIVTKPRFSCPRRSDYPPFAQAIQTGAAAPRFG